jgi:hypothetical protein
MNYVLRLKTGLNFVAKTEGNVEIREIQFYLNLDHKEK